LAEIPCSTLKSAEPAWRTPRETHRFAKPRSQHTNGGCCGGCCGEVCCEYEELEVIPPNVVADEFGFPWGRHLESSRGTSWCTSGRLLVSGCNGVSIDVESEHGRERMYLAVVLPLEVLLREVYLSDGRRFSPNDGTVEATCRATLIKPTTNPEAWRTVPIVVRVTVPDHASLLFAASAENPSPLHTLERVEDPGAR
jgi:hypothetical protein